MHLHPTIGGEPFHSVEFIEVVAGKGIAGNPRYFDRGSRRQVTLMEREQIAEHAATLGRETIPPGAVRSNIETAGLSFTPLVGQEVQVGEAVLRLYAPRDPCAKMEAIAYGLRHLMSDGRQGVLAQVIQSGRIRVGDTIHLVKAVTSP